MTEVFRFTYIAGTVDLPRPIGPFRKEADGCWRQPMSDWIERDQYGREVSRRPAEPGIGIRWDDDRDYFGIGDPAPCRRRGLMATLLTLFGRAEPTP